MKKGFISAAIFAILILALYFLNKQDIKVTQVSETQQDSIQTDTMHQIIPKRLVFGIEVDSNQVDILKSKIKRNQFLSNILGEYNVPPIKIHELANKSKAIFDVRHIAYNKKYTLIHKKDSLKTASHFIYEPNEYEYVVFDLSDSVNIYKEKKPVDTVRQTFAGVIEYSLYQTMTDQGAPLELASALSDVYAWQIDFFRIQKFDKFKVVYQEVQVEGKPIGVGKILAAEFDHFGNKYMAYSYDQGDGLDYFDEEGNSLRKEFLKAPLKYSRISSGFTYSRLHPVLKIRRPHTGVDYAAPTGTPVRSIGDGIIIGRYYSKGGGNVVKIKHNGVYTTAYLHLNGFAKGIANGKKVKQGQIIGYVGSTGLSTGPHLDFRCWKNGKPINPLKIEAPPSKPINEAHKQDYFNEMLYLQDELEIITYPQVEVLASGSM